MNKYIKFLIFFIICAGTSTTQQSCKVKEGCGQEEMYAPNMESKGGNSNLFSKKQRKKMKKKG